MFQYGAIYQQNKITPFIGASAKVPEADMTD